KKVESCGRAAAKILTSAISRARTLCTPLSLSPFDCTVSSVLRSRRMSWTPTRNPTIACWSVMRCGRHSTQIDSLHRLCTRPAAFSPGAVAFLGVCENLGGIYHGGSYEIHFEGLFRLSPR